MRITTGATAAALSGLAGLHIAWGLGSPFPSANRTELADTVAGTKVVPSAPQCFAVAGALVGAAALVTDALPLARRQRTIGASGAALVLGMRGVLGVAGQTSRIVPWTPSDRFTKLDRRYYGPLCLALSAGVWSSLRSD